MQINSLFDPSKDIYRTIEKVITYGAAQGQRLQAEIAEYVVTDSMAFFAYPPEKVYSSSDSQS